MQLCDHATCEKRSNNYAETYCMVAGCGGPPTHLVKAEPPCAGQVRMVAPASASMDGHALRREGLVTPDVRNALPVALISLWRCSLPELNSLVELITLCCRTIPFFRRVLSGAKSHGDCSDLDRERPSVLRGTAKAPCLRTFQN